MDPILQRAHTHTYTARSLAREREGKPAPPAPPPAAAPPCARPQHARPQHARLPDSSMTRPTTDGLHMMTAIAGPKTHGLRGGVGGEARGVDGQGARDAADDANTAPDCKSPPSSLLPSLCGDDAVVRRLEDDKPRHICATCHATDPQIAAEGICARPLPPVGAQEQRIQ